MKKGTLHWFAVEYHFPSTYSLSSSLKHATSALISPGPEPATVRLALIRVGIELFGSEVVREVLFPWICSARLRLRPPERIAISESVVYREMAHAQGSLVLYMELPLEEQDRWHLLLRSVGYWGQASSFTSCLRISENAPVTNECVLPLHEVSTSIALQPFFSCILSEFRDSQLSWHDVIPQEGDGSSKTVSSAFTWKMYVWPLQIIRQTSRSTLLVRSPLL